MKINFNSREELALYYDFKVESKQDIDRLDIAWNYYVINYRKDGLYGCLRELLSCSSGSGKNRVAPQGKDDTRLLVRYPSGSVVPVRMEVKTNGGRLDGILEGGSKWVLYSMDVCNSTTNYLRRTVQPKIYSRKSFLEALIAFKAIKTISHKGKFEGYAIQVSSKQLWLWLCENGIDYDRNKVYELSELQNI